MYENICRPKAVGRCREENMKVYIKNKLLSLSGKSDVLDISGNPIYEVKGRVISPTKVKHVCTLDGEKLYKVRNRFFNFFIHSSFVYGADKKRILKVKDTLFSPDFKIQSSTGDEYSILGKWFSMQAQIIKNGQVVGTIRRQFTVVADAFELECGEADMPFMIALVIAVDNICDKRSKS